MKIFKVIFMVAIVMAGTTSFANNSKKEVGGQIFCESKDFVCVGIVIIDAIASVSQIDAKAYRQRIYRSCTYNDSVCVGHVIIDAIIAD